MEKESFEDLEVAEFLNQHFISIKVDREERPDIDHIYMEVCQTLTGSGGWPLSLFLTPDKEPFFAGTYIPKKSRMGMAGFLSILEGVRSAWDNNPEYLMESSKKILNVLQQTQLLIKKEIEQNIVDQAFKQYRNDFDSIFGGFGSAPKFPSPHNLYFLTRYWYHSKNQQALDMVEKTLDAMYQGGIFDHIGFGFSRYSTDRKWLVPHFEKMLYDNALLAIAYLELYQIKKENRYAEIAKQIFCYVLRDMTSEEGGFYSAEDADSEGEEGKFYLWTMDEIIEVLGKEEGIKFCEYFDITEKGNFEGKNIPNLMKTPLNIMESEFIIKSREKLFQKRLERVFPHKDDKVLTAWNGLMIAALAIGGRVLGDKKYTSAAEKAVEFLENRLFREDGRLLARYRDGEAAFLAYADDYAFYIWGLIELYETTFKSNYLEKALKLNGDLISLFWDNEKGGLFIYGSDGEKLIIRPKEIYDGAIPSGNSVAALNFLRLARITGQQELEGKAYQLLNVFGNRIESYPKGYAFSLMAILYMQSEGKEIIIAGQEGEKELQKMISKVQVKFSPFSSCVVVTGQQDDICDLIPFISNYKSVEGKPTAYICEKYVCREPITDSSQLEKML
ncbi:hypothetical protein SAMN05661086_02148 [Anaeromicropila populeti]|uniref:Spermatogenesis-associated protein 20-like TRX domain-containing protein n=1 Tax=Anaeromicropila populeti TaxID=37658 RepID=A0A1I6K089_9FIRM|nr:hypothetical protein SAMN05661086_02148 [Anaeromicropila populeti]